MISRTTITLTMLLALANAGCSNFAKDRDAAADDSDSSASSEESPTVFRGKLQIATPADEAIAEYRVSAGEAGASYPEPVLTCVDSLSGTYTRKARTLVFSFNGAEETIGLSDDAVARVEAKIAELAFLEEARNGCEVTGMPPQIVLKNAQGEDQYSADTCNQLGVTGISELLAEFAAVAGKSCD